MQVSTHNVVWLQSGISFAFGLGQVLQGQTHFQTAGVMPFVEEESTCAFLCSFETRFFFDTSPFGFAAACPTLRYANFFGYVMLCALLVCA